jgi:N-acetylmuramoyl-L-alanine amidase
VLDVPDALLDEAEETMKRNLAVLTVAFLVVGCQHVAAPPVTSIARTPLGPQEGGGEPSHARGALTGRVVCIDPGHGEPWSGAVAPSNGLKESDVNLCVAMRAARALELAGADVILTRTTDGAVIPDSLSRDLAARPALANDRQVDAFVSIHHNADIAPDSERNDLEVYYKLGDEAASLVLAQCLMQSLAVDLRADAAAKLLYPGNYKVLRQAGVPAVLLEASYLTSSENATLLATETALDREAEAISAGIHAYFELDPPRTSEAIVRSLEGGKRHEFEICFSRGIPIDPQTVEAKAGSVPVPGACTLTNAGFAWSLRSPLPNGAHEVTFTGRNNWGAGFRCVVPVAVDRAPARIEITQEPEVIPKSTDFEALLRVRVFDALGLPVSDGTEVSLEKDGMTATTCDGEARFYILGPRGRYRASAGDVRRSLRVRRGSSVARAVRFVNATPLKPVPGVVVRHDEGFSVATPEGWAALPRDYGTLTASAPGYEPMEASMLMWVSSAFELKPIDGGVLLGKVIALDPAFGGRGAGAVDPVGRRACDVNMDIVKMTASRLRNAGATVIVTRTEDVGATDLRRLLTVEACGPEVLISVSFDAPGGAARVLDETGHRRDRVNSFTGHYPGSSNGKRLAGAIAGHLGAAEVVETVTYLVQQTSCPAVVVQPGRFEDLGPEEMESLKKRCAAAIYDALVDYFSK